MPLRVSAVSEAERQQIEQEWDTGETCLHVLAIA